MARNTGTEMQNSRSRVLLSSAMKFGMDIEPSLLTKAKRVLLISMISFLTMGRYFARFDVVLVSDSFI